MMKTNRAVKGLAVCGAMAFSVGCAKNEGIVPPIAKDTQTPAAAAAAQFPKAAEAQQMAGTERTAQAAQAANAQKLTVAEPAPDVATPAEAAKAMLSQAAAEKLAAERTTAEKLPPDCRRRALGIRPDSNPDRRAEASDQVRQVKM